MTHKGKQSQYGRKGINGAYKGLPKKKGSKKKGY